jgi:crotonobetainyl-CoA:carnitine CoA-transferase CaiB-like acyl-CoA transferase
LSLLVERAALLGHRTWGTTSAGTSCRMLRCADGWVAINLPRTDDIDAVPALLGLLGAADAGGLVDGAATDSSGVWEALAPAVATAATTAVVDAARLLGIAAAAAPSIARNLGPNDSSAVSEHRVAAAGVVRRHDGDASKHFEPAALRVTAGPAFSAAGERAPRVVDLSSLWAGPLCGWYLARAGADVTKVESTSRPDGARAGTPTFWRRLNAGKTLVEVDLGTPAGVDQLRRLVADADIVIEASRPRAMAGFGIDPADVVARGGIWCSISGYGRGAAAPGGDGPDRIALGGGVDRIAFGDDVDRIAFGDDAAVAGGLIADTGDEPWFIGDAAADPIAGVTAALGVAALWLQGSGGLVDVSMADAVAALTDGGPVACTP